MTTIPSVVNNQVVNTNVTVGVTSGQLVVNGKEVDSPYTASENGTYTASITDKYNAKNEVTFTINKELAKAPTITVTPLSAAKEVSVTINYPENAADKWYVNGTRQEVTEESVTFTVNENTVNTAINIH